MKYLFALEESLGRSSTDPSSTSPCIRNVRPERVKGSRSRGAFAVSFPIAAQAANQRNLFLSRRDESLFAHCSMWREASFHFPIPSGADQFQTRSRHFDFQESSSETVAGFRWTVRIHELSQCYAQFVQTVPA